MSYRRMTYTDRLIIERCAAAGLSKSAIARRTGFTPSAIIYELKRGQYLRAGYQGEYFKAYSADIGQQSADFCATSKGRPLKLGSNYQYANMVSDMISSGMSPDAVVGLLRRQGRFTVSTPTLYRYIDRGFIPGISNDCLFRKPRMKKHYRYVHRHRRAPYGVSIERRPQEIADRNTFGHWEIDCVIGRSRGHGQALLVLTERLTRYEVIRKLKTKEASVVLEAVADAVRRYGILSLTCDNGSEFAQLHSLPIPVYYCHPYTSCERGSNENANAIIRRFYPKKTDFSQITQRDCDVLQLRINSLVRKSLGYRSSGEIFTHYFYK